MNNPKEILWEFTLKCNKNCCYCGSKKILNNIKLGDISYSREYIANQIIKVKPEEVTITGGEPSCEITDLVKCVKILYDAGIKVKILTNGNLFQIMAGDSDLFDNLDKMVTCYGLSLNELSDLNSIGEAYSIKEKTTVITNFGTHNINDFDKIAKKSMQYNCWQVQLTIGNEYQLDIDQIKELQNKLEKVENSGLLNVVRADNFTCGKCKAGIYGFSITYDGLIVPCLSYRSWKSDMMVQGMVSEIEDVWKNGFKFNRERKFVPSCKTISGIEKLCLTNEEYEPIKRTQIGADELNKLEKILKEQQKENVIFMYGVVNPLQNDWNTPLVYGVTNPMYNLTNIEDLKDFNNNPDIQKFLKDDNKNDKENN